MFIYKLPNQFLIKNWEGENIKETTIQTLYSKN